ncbi:MAG: hypothetical protein ACTHKY_04210 [Ginsengibacter sp.]|jgi:hypothetical protein
MKSFCLLICLAFCNCIQAQSADDSVRSAVNQLFTAMKDADSALLVSSFADSAILQTIIEKNGKVVVKTEAVGDLAAQVAKMEKNILDERIKFDVVRIDGALAMVWAPYQFYYKGKFSHCGTDSFQLVRINGK